MCIMTSAQWKLICREIWDLLKEKFLNETRLTRWRNENSKLCVYLNWILCVAEKIAYLNLMTMSQRSLCSRYLLGGSWVASRSMSLFFNFELKIWLKKWGKNERISLLGNSIRYRRDEISQLNGPNYFVLWSITSSENFKIIHVTHLNYTITKMVNKFINYD